jgi:hypothetical protein
MQWPCVVMLDPAHVVMVALLFGVPALGVYELAVLGDACVGSSYLLLPCFCVWLTGLANLGSPVAVILAVHKKTQLPLFVTVVAKALAYTLAAQHAADFALSDTRTRLMFADTGVLMLASVIVTVSLRVGEFCQKHKEQHEQRFHSLLNTDTNARGDAISGTLGIHVDSLDTHVDSLDADAPST